MTIDEKPQRVHAVPRTQDRMTHDVWLPEEIVELRTEARAAVEKRLVPYARDIGQREESADSFPWEAFRGLAEERRQRGEATGGPSPMTPKDRSRLLSKLDELVNVVRRAKRGAS